MDKNKGKEEKRYRETEKYNSLETNGKSIQ